MKRVFFLFSILLLFSFVLCLAFIMHQRRVKAWKHAYHGRLVADAKFSLTVVTKLRNGETNNLLPYIETRMLMVATEISREKALSHVAESEDDSNLLKNICHYSLKHALFENYKGLLSHEAAHKALERPEGLG